jgi:ligand-binding sensor domain-containing protein
MRAPSWRFWSALGTAALALAGTLASVRWMAQRALDRAAVQVQAEQNLDVDIRPLSLNPATKFEWIGSPLEVSEIAQFRGHLYLAGPGGLEEYGANGALERSFRPGAELPPSPVTHLAVGVLPDSREPELILATAREGLVAFDGEHFRQIYPRDGIARKITAILPLSSGRLLLGTEKAGVMVYDGKHIRAFHLTLSNVHITALAGDEADLWVGTLDRGVLHRHAGRTDIVSEAEGLPDPQVLSILRASDAQTFVGTPVGVAEFVNGKFDRVIARGAFAESLAISGDALLVGTMDQGILRVPLEANVKAWGARADALSGDFSGSAPSLDDVRYFANLGDSVYAVAREGIFQQSDRGFSWKRVLENSSAALADRNVSALGIGADGNLWVGYFDRGMDLLDSVEQHARHMEDQHIFCVNRIVSSPDGATTAVATANGLAIFDRTGHARQILTHADGLIADHVSDVAFDGDRIVAATPAGITFFGAGGARSIYAFQGLINNHVYAIAFAGPRMMAGTLGGLSLVERERVLASYTMANSALPKNWISAVVPLGDGWMAGTYGGGAVRIGADGGVHAYDLATGPIEINPNAMLATDQHIFAGSLGRGMFIYDRAADRWSNLRDGLPSLDVTAFASAHGYLYIGTDDGLVRIREKDLAP